MITLNDKTTKCGLTSFQLKVIALIFMTIDHIGAYGFEIPIVGRYYSYFRYLGRIAAPLFLFVMAQSVRHTRSKLMLIRRLYLAGMFYGLLDVIMSFYCGNFLNLRGGGNSIFFTFFYTALYIYLIELVICGIKSKSVPRLLLGLSGILAAYLPTLIYPLVDTFIVSHVQNEHFYLVQGLRDSFLPSALHVEYGAGFIVLGIILYFVKTKKRQCTAFAAFCLICVAGTLIRRSLGGFALNFSFANIFFSVTQCFMVFALPFMMLYNGNRGKPWKWFFYLYYPSHIYAIRILSRIIAPV